MGGLAVAHPARARRGEIHGVDPWIDVTASADGSQILFSSLTQGDEGIWSLPLRVAERAIGRTLEWSGVRPRCRRLTTDSTDRDPALSPGGELLAFSRHARIALAELRSRTVEFITPENPYERAGRLEYLGDILPSWSPAGTHLVCTRCEPGSAPQLWVIELATGTTRQLTRAELGTHSPVWSPQGNAIAAIRNVTPTLPDQLTGDVQDGRLVCVEPEGGEDVYSWAEATVEELVDWRPDGRGVAFRADHVLWVVEVLPEPRIARMLTGVGPGVAIVWGA